MRIKVSLPAADAKTLREKILESADTVEKDETGEDEWETASSAEITSLQRNAECLPLNRSSSSTPVSSV